MSLVPRLITEIDTEISQLQIQLNRLGEVRNALAQTNGTEPAQVSEPVSKPTKAARPRKKRARAANITPDTLRASVTDLQQFTPQGLADKLGVSISAAHRHIAKLIERREIELVGAKGAQDRYYRVPHV